MDARLSRLVADEIWHFLHRQGPRPQMLRAASLEEHAYDFRWRLRFVLVDGVEWNVELNGERFAYYGRGDARLFSNECVRLYSQMLEDHLLEAQLRSSRENLHRIAELATDRAQLQRAYLQHEEFERHLLQHHRVRRDHPLMPVPVEPYAGVDQVGPATEGTFTLESLRQMRRHYYDDLAAFGHMIVGIGIDWAANEKAQARALALLKAHLSPAQLAQYEEKRHFEVIGSHSGKRYRIRYGRQMNIDELDADGGRVCGWCFLPQGGLVEGDVMLGQKIALECDEAAALKVANRFGASLGMPLDGMRLMPYSGNQIYASDPGV